MAHSPKKNWFTAMGILFMVVAVIPIIRDLLIFGPAFMPDFFTSHALTTEKISMAVIGFGGFLIILGLREGHHDG